MSSTDQEFKSIIREPTEGSLHRTKDLFVLPGILGYGGVQVRPLVPALLEKGYFVRPFSYREDVAGWDPECVAVEVAQLVRASLRAGNQPTILGISLGGLLAAMAASHLTTDELSKLTVVAVDSPYGVETLVAVPNLLRSAFSGSVPRLFRGERSSRLLARYLGGNGKLNRKFVEFPDTLRTDDEKAAYLDWLDEQALEGVTGHDVKIWYQQIGWLAAKLQPSLSILQGAQWVLYLQCRPLDDDPRGLKNEVVNQPRALQA